MSQNGVQELDKWFSNLSFCFHLFWLFFYLRFYFYSFISFFVWYNATFAVSWVTFRSKSNESFSVKKFDTCHVKVCLYMIWSYCVYKYIFIIQNITLCIFNGVHALYCMCIVWPEKGWRPLLLTIMVYWILITCGFWWSSGSKRSAGPQRISWYCWTACMYHKMFSLVTNILTSWNWRPNTCVFTHAGSDWFGWTTWP